MRNRLLYVAYPMRLDLGAANAIQTFSTVRELQRIMPNMRLVVPRWLNEPSAFAELNALHLPRPAVNKLSKFVPWAGWSHIERTIYSLILVALLLLRRAGGRGYNTLYVRDAVCGAWMAVLKPLHGARVIYEVHDLEALHPSHASHWPEKLWRYYLPWLDNTALRRSSRLVSLTASFKQWVVARKIRAANDIDVIPDAFDPALYKPGDSKAARVELGLPMDVPIIGYAGLTFAYRRLDLLVEAFADVLKEYPDVVLALVGGRQNEVAEMKLLAERLGIPASQIGLAGQVSQERAALFLQAADVLVIPDTVTGMTASPLKLFEYMAVGRPIVCKEMPALREILDDSTAQFFRGGDVEALSVALRAVLADPQRAWRMGDTALRRSANYTYKQRAQNIKRIIQS